MNIHDYGDLIILEYNGAELYTPNGERHLKSEEYIQLENWLFSVFSKMNQYAVRNPENLRYRLVDKIVRCLLEKCCFCKKLRVYAPQKLCGRFKSLPDVQVRVTKF